jgi:signal transduction histidine kinase
MVRSLQTKLIGIVLVIVVGVTVVFVAASIQKTKRIIHEQAEAFGIALVRGIASASANLLVQDGEKLQLTKGIRAIGQAFPLIRTISVFYDATKLAEFVGRAEVADETLSRTFREPIVIHPPAGTPYEYGRVEMEYSLQEFFRLFVTDLKPFFTSGALFLYGIIVVLFIVIHFLIIRPLKLLRVGTSTVGAGDLDYTIDITSNDEFGELADSFNRMTRQLKHARAEIEQWNRMLEAKVDERTRELEAATVKINEMQMQMIQSGKLAAVGMVGAEVAHELNNPLSFILGYAQMMHQKVKKGEVPLETFEKYLATIVKETKRCAGIVKDIAGFSKRSSEAFSETDMREVIRTTITIMKYQFKKWKIELSYDLPDHPLVINGNADKLQQIFINLIANAHHAMPDGGAITIGLHPETFEGQQVAAARVRDTGCGIAKENIDKLFASFFSTKADKTNLGLGLAISLRIVEEHAGVIAVESEPGEGTTFIIRLPRAGEKGFAKEPETEDGFAARSAVEEV